MKEVFARPAAFMFNTAAERAMLAGRFSFEGKYPGHRRRRRGHPRSGRASAELRPQISRLSRLMSSTPAGSSRARAAREIFENFLRLGRGIPDLSLVLIGKLLMPLPDHPRIRYLGFVSPEEKNAAMARAAGHHPSLAFREPVHGRPGVDGRPDARSSSRSGPSRSSSTACEGNGGLYYSNAEEFGVGRWSSWSATRLRADPGRNGLDYVHKNYTWARVLENMIYFSRTM